MNGVSAVRNTCFALLSAIEVDLRETIADLALKENVVKILPDDVRENAAPRFEQDDKHRPDIVPDDLDLLGYTDFADLSKMMRMRIRQISELAGKDVDPIATQIEALTPARNRVCHSRPLDEDDLPRFLDLSKMLLRDYPALGWRELRSVTLKMQEDPSFVFRISIPRFWRIGGETIPHNLPLPDFDETGFLGRTTEKREVMKHLLGPHPVISIVGEGGVGKSALAIRCLYDLMDLGDAEAPFEAIVWVSLKSKVLTSSGVREIRDSVTSTLGLIQAAVSALGSPVAATSIDVDQLLNEMRDYLDRLRILLVIDNYESLTSDALRPFLMSVPRGSKVLITSRIGLGEIEVRYKLDPLDRKTATSLVRRYAKALNLQFLVAASDKRLERYCSLLYENPLLIKWFVSGVAAGEDPEAIVAHGTLGFEEALKFCFENLFNRLTPIEGQILHVLASARRQVTQAELYFLLEKSTSVEQHEVERTTAILHNSSMLKRSLADTKRIDSAVQIALTDVAADYIARFAPPPRTLFERVQSALKGLREISEQSAVKLAIYKYDIFAIRAINTDQRISGAFLHSALMHLNRGASEEAIKMVEKARRMLPSYPEVSRIAAIVHTKAGDLYKATQEIEIAIDLDPTAALPRYQYALFQLNNFDDSQSALAQIDAALTLDVGDETLETARALCLVRLGRSREAAEIYERVLKNLPERSRKWRVTTRDQAAECYRRWAEHDRIQRDNVAARSHLARAIGLLDEALANNDYDERTASLYASVIEDALFLAISLANPEYAAELLSTVEAASYLLKFPFFRRLSLVQFTMSFLDQSSLLDTAHRMTGVGRLRWHEEAAGPPIQESGDSPSGNEFQGVIKIIKEGTEYGFLVDASGTEWFFHRNHMVKKHKWDTLRSGQRVRFRQGQNTQGKCAVKVEVLEAG